MEIPQTDLTAAATDDAGRSRRRPGRLTTTIVAAGAAAGMFAAGLGIAGAQSEETPTPSAETSPAPTEEAERGRGHRHGIRSSLDAAAAAIGVTPEELRTALRAGQSMADVARSKDVDPKKVADALVADARVRVAEKVAAGELTQAQADARLGDVDARAAAAVERVGKGGRDGGQGHGRRGGHGVKPGLDAAAAAIGVTPAELRTALQAGQSLADVARAEEVDPMKVIDALVAEARIRIEAEVTAGRLTRAQADARLATLEARMTEAVDRVGGGRHGHRREGMATDRAATAATAPAKLEA